MISERRRSQKTKEDGAIYEGEGKADREVMIVSGAVKFDGLGRTVKAWYPITEAKSKTPGMFNGNKNESVDPTVTTYDVLNRILTVTLP